MHTNKTIDLPDHIKYENTELTIDNVSAVELIKEYGTPLFVISEKQVRQNYNRLRKAFSRYPDCTIAYSYKTNYLPAVCNILHHEGAGAEVVSAFELLLAKKLGMPSSKIIFNGPGKSDKEIEMFIGDDIALVNADSMEELERINQIAKAKGKIVDVGIRVKPDVPDFFVCPKFGMDIATGQAFKAYQKASELKNLNVVGMHAHIGTKICSTRSYTEGIRQMAKLMSKVNAELGIEFEFFDIGGGFGVPSFTPLFPTEEKVESTATIEQFGESIVEAFLSCISDYNLSEPTLVLELGRIIITDPALILTMVEGTKVIGGSTKTVVVDAGVNLIMFAPYYYHRIVPVVNTERAKEAVDVYGPLCMQMDVLGVNRKLPVLVRGFFLAILDAGAYSISLSQQFIRPRPPVVMVNGGRKRLVRRGETFDDIFNLNSV
nr:probable diaminopimelate decarboxylase [uncultured archaeon]